MLFNFEPIPPSWILRCPRDRRSFHLIQLLALHWSSQKLCSYRDSSVRFSSKVISPKVPNWSSDSWSKALLNKDSTLPRNSTSKVFSCYRPLRWILSCAMGHYGKFGCALYATAADLFICNGPLRLIWLCAIGHCAEWSPTVKIYIDFSARGHSRGFGYALWAIARGLVLCYRP
jgi:hypothetical protein